MTRSEARELGMRISFGISTTDRDSVEATEEFLDKEYYESLKGEDGLFENYPEKKQIDYLKRLVNGIAQHSAELDTYVDKYSKKWEFHRISRTALAIIKVAMFEIMYMDDIPDGVSANEAVELAKKYDEPETVPFINGVLGTFIREEASQLR